METIIGTEAPSLAAKRIRVFFFYKHICRRGDRLHSNMADQSSDDTLTEKHSLILKELREWSKKCGKAVFHRKALQNEAVQGMEIRDTRIVSRTNSA